VSWFRIQSWHITRHASGAVPGRVIALCGRVKDDAVLRATFPPDEKTCESCWRVHGRRTV
jgi:hypothetical protein